MNVRTFERARRALARNGYSAGAAAGGWIIDGNTSAAEAAAWLVGIAEGDPAVLEQLPTSPLSGEWADGPTPDGVLAEVGVSLDPDDPEQWEVGDELLRAFEEGFDAGAADEVVWSAANVLGVKPDLEPTRSIVSDAERVRRSAARFALTNYGAAARAAAARGGPRDPMGGRVNFDPERGA